MHPVSFYRDHGGIRTRFRPATGDRPLAFAGHPEHAGGLSEPVLHGHARVVIRDRL